MNSMAHLNKYSVGVIRKTSDAKRTTITYKSVARLSLCVAGCLQNKLLARYGDYCATN